MDCQDCRRAESELLLTLGLGDPSEKRWLGHSPVLMGFFVWTLFGCVFQTSVTTHFRQMTGHFRLSMTACFRISVTAFALSSEMHFA